METAPIGHELTDTPDVQEYELLVGHNRTDGSYRSTEQLQSEYVRLTDNLVRHMVDGMPFTSTQTGETTTERPDVVVWLDKSARPLAWMTKELWPTLAADKDGEVSPMPHFAFVNIDREQWVNELDPHGNGVVNMDLISPSVIRSLRSIFIDPVHKPATKDEALTEDIDHQPTSLDGKNVLIIDEVQATGRTLRYASAFFKQAFPEARIATDHWMKGVAAKGTAMGNADLPVWYVQNDVYGRGVGNRNPYISHQSESATQRLGAWFLSTRLPGVDLKTEQLRKEIHQLGNDVRDHKVFVMPSMERDNADFDERIARLNGVDNVQEAVALKRALDSRAVHEKQNH